MQSGWLNMVMWLVFDGRLNDFAILDVVSVIFGRVGHLIMLFHEVRELAILLLKFEQLHGSFLMKRCTFGAVARQWFDLSSQLIILGLEAYLPLGNNGKLLLNQQLPPAYLSSVHVGVGQLQTTVVLLCKLRQV